MPGEEGGAAIAGVLSGRSRAQRSATGAGASRILVDNPAPTFNHRLAPTAHGISSLDPTALFPFGHGLSYTTYEYSDLELSATEVPVDGELVISATVRNVGHRAGEEVAQLYLHDVQGQVTRPLQQLAGFTRVPLAPGQSARVSFTLHADRTSFTGTNLNRVVEPGDIEVAVGRSASDLPLLGRFELTGSTRELGQDRVLVTPVEVEFHTQP